jgi:hypothetical protein
MWLEFLSEHQSLDPELFHVVVASEELWLEVEFDVEFSSRGAASAQSTDAVEETLPETNKNFQAVCS